jgi:hypothetical protein
MDLTIIRKDGTTYKLSDYNIKVIDFKVSAPTPKHNFREPATGADGFIDMGTTFDGRDITVNLYARGVDGWDFALLRDEIFNIFNSKEAVYVIDSREPGKRWLVKTNAYTPDQLTDTQGFIEIPLISKSPYAESVGTTLTDLTYDADAWQYGQNLSLDEPKYKHTTSSFSIYNASTDVIIDPRFMPLKITFTGASTDLTINNVTTGDEWKYTGITLPGAVIRLDGVRYTKNSSSIFRDTNHKVITLKPGWNDFQITGATGSFEIEFDFRFYYL